VLLADAPLTFREFAMHEPLPLASIFRAIFEFLRDRSDVVLFGAHAVNAYCTEERMTQDVDLLALDAQGTADTLRAHLFERFHVAIRVREVSHAEAYRIYQVRDPKNRHLVDLRQVSALPPSRITEGVRVVAPEQLAALKVLALHSRANKPKGGTDLVDLKRLLLALPELQTNGGETVANILSSTGASAEVLALWQNLANTPLEADDDDY
jgi:Nucleotidyl transferase AbiEii toxin, Type IV TA system